MRTATRLLRKVWKYCGKRWQLNKDRGQNRRMSRLILILLVAAPLLAPEADGAPAQSLLRMPLPPEELRLTRSRTELAIEGPTFSYRVQRKTGAIEGLRVVRGQQEVISSG